MHARHSGKRYYMKSIYGATTTRPDDDFFTQSRPRVASTIFFGSTLQFPSQTAYKNWVSYLLNRVNTLTNVAYKNEPTILAWDLMNEPTLTNGYDATRGVAVGSTLRTWVNEMTAHVRTTLQAKQLVFVGDVRCD